MYQFRLTVECETEKEKFRFKRSVSGGQFVPFSINRVYRKKYIDFHTINKIIKETDTSIVYFFDSCKQVTHHFFENLTKRYPENKYTLIVQKNKRNYWEGGFLKIKLLFGKGIEPKHLSSEDFSCQVYKNAIKKLLKRLIKVDFKSISFYYEFCELIKNYHIYESETPDIGKNEFFYNIYSNITQPECKIYFHQRFAKQLRVGKINHLD